MGKGFGGGAVKVFWCGKTICEGHTHQLRVGSPRWEGWHGSVVTHITSEWEKSPEASSEKGRRGRIGGNPGISRLQFLGKEGPHAVHVIFLPNEYCMLDDSFPTEGNSPVHTVLGDPDPPNVPAFP